MEKNVNLSIMTESEKNEWDNSATSEDKFVWERSDKNNTYEYGIIKAFKASIYDNKIIKIPSRCVSISSAGIMWDDGRSYNNIKNLITKICPICR